jgi:hypothetical protein
MKTNGKELQNCPSSERASPRINSCIKCNHKRLMLFQGIVLTVIQICWFSPIVAHKQLNNAFALPYIGVNITAYYGNLAIMGVLSIPIAKTANTPQR